MALPASHNLGKLRQSAVLLGALLCAACSEPVQTKPLRAPEAFAPMERTPLFIDLLDFRPELILAPPPAVGSDREKSELAELHQIQAVRTQAQLAQALRDDKDESIFLFADVLGEKFSSDSLPATAELGRVIRIDAEIIASLAKRRFGRIRPYALDKTIVGCPYDRQKAVNTSYPSGHAMNGYSYGLVLAAMLPRRTEAIMARARTYADQRVVCGHHYRSDVEASAVLAAVLVRDLMSRPAFLGKVNASLAELRGASLDQ